MTTLASRGIPAAPPTPADAGTGSVLPGRILALVPVLLAATGLVVLGGRNLLPATTLLEVSFVVVVVCGLPWTRARVPVVVLAVGALLLVRLLQSSTTTATLFDVVQANMWLVYLVLLALLTSVTVRSRSLLALSTRVLVGAATLKYLLVLATQGAGQRPGLLVENNYELTMLCGLVAVLYADLGRRRLGWVLLLGLATVVSGSRSGAAAFLVLAIYVVVQERHRLGMLGRFLAVVGAAGATLVPLAVFSARSGAATIDRERFLEVFLAETSHWGVAQWLVGQAPMTPLSPAGCRELSYYQTLVSTTGECYSVILHSFVLRAVFDTGVLGLALALLTLWLVLRAAGVGVPLALALWALAVANGISVSGLNNVYVLWPCAVAVVLATRPPRPAPGLARPPFPPSNDRTP